MTVLKPSGVNLKRDALPPPLLKPALSPGAADTTTLQASIPPIRMADGMTGMPADVRALLTWHVRGPSRTIAGMKPRADATSEVGQSTVPHVDPDEVRLPKLNHMHTMLEEDMAAGVFDVSIHASGGGKVRLLIEAPLVWGESSEQGLFKGQMGLDPGDI